MGTDTENRLCFISYDYDIIGTPNTYVLGVLYYPLSRIHNATTAHFGLDITVHNLYLFKK
jgi:hypothetical protein